jgi:hypothetical protein
MRYLYDVFFAHGEQKYCEKVGDWISLQRELKLLLFGAAQQNVQATMMPLQIFFPAPRELFRLKAKLFQDTQEQQKVPLLG